MLNPCVKIITLTYEWQLNLMDKGSICIQERLCHIRNDWQTFNFPLPAFTVSGTLLYDFHWVEMTGICCGLIFTMKCQKFMKLSSEFFFYCSTEALNLIILCTVARLTDLNSVCTSRHCRERMALFHLWYRPGSSNSNPIWLILLAL